ncbi:MAG: hypothetical protein AAGM40_24020, partial [Cyanobacteria bacterium J06573_2]
LKIDFKISLGVVISPILSVTISIKYLRCKDFLFRLDILFEAIDSQHLESQNLHPKFIPKIYTQNFAIANHHHREE